MKKILFIHHTSGWGGSANSLIKLIEYLDKSEYETKVLLLKKSEIEERLLEKGIKYQIAASPFYRKYYQFFPHSEAGYLHWYNIIKFLKLSILWLLSRYYFSARELALHDFNIIHFNTSVLTDWLSPARKRGKVIMHLREPFRKGRLDFLNPFFKSVIKRNTDKIIAISQDNSKRLGLQFKTEIVYNYSEIPLSKPADGSYSSGIVLYLGGSSTSKGFYTMVDALDYLDYNVKVYFGGKYVFKDKPHHPVKYLKYYISNDRKRAKAIKKILEYSRAELIGLINDTDKYMDMMCCLVSPFALPHFSRPVIEAHLHRKPVIGSDVEGMDEIIENDENGLIIPRNNPEELASAINRITADWGKARELGEAGYVIAIKKFTPLNIKQIEKIYSTL